MTIPTDRVDDLARKRTTNFTLLLMACMLAWVSLMAGFVQIAPVIEAKFFPPLINVKPTNIVRTEKSICWYTAAFKSRNAVLEQALFWLEYGSGTHEAIRVTLAGKLFPPIEVIPPDTQVKLGPFCADLPMTNGHITVDVETSQTKLSGELIYRTNLFWVISETLPFLVVPKVNDIIHYGSDRDINREPCTQCHHGK